RPGRLVRPGARQDVPPPDRLRSSGRSRQHVSPPMAAPHDTADARAGKPAGDDLKTGSRQGDRALILPQRPLEQITHAPEIEQDMAVATLALDLLGQARALYNVAGDVEGLGRDEDHFASWRDAAEFDNPLLVEQPAPDFAHV